MASFCASGSPEIRRAVMNFGVAMITYFAATVRSWPCLDVGDVYFVFLRVHGDDCGVGHHLRRAYFAC